MQGVDSLMKFGRVWCGDFDKLRPRVKGGSICVKSAVLTLWLFLRTCSEWRVGVCAREALPHWKSGSLTRAAQLKAIVSKAIEQKLWLCWKPHKMIPVL